MKMRPKLVDLQNLNSPKNDLLSQLWAELQYRRGRPESDLISCELGVQFCTKPQKISSVVFNQPAALMVISGRKEIHVGNNVTIAQAGQMLIVPADVKVWMAKFPDEKTGEYQGLGIRFDLDTVTQFQYLYGKSMDSWVMEPNWNSKISDGILEWVLQWLNWSRRYPGSTQIQRHRLIELLLLFAQSGVAGNLLLGRNPSLRQRVVQILYMDPSKDWRCAEVCKKIGMSETVLRRKLLVEETGFRELLEEMRLMTSLRLVQETKWTILRVADAVGYKSQSRFTERFKLRFGMTPTELRRGDVNY